MMSGLPMRDLRLWLHEAGMLAFEPVTIGAPMTAEVVGACVDSRRAAPGSLFVALPGERTDGHEYVDHAAQGGAVAALVLRDRLEELRRKVYGSTVLFPVHDTLRAFHEIARRWRSLHSELVRIGITGSNGKTTAKELLAAVLSQVAVTIHSRGNYNSDIGLPMEVLRIRSEHQFGVFELGMNRPGEIHELAELVEPGIAVITNIGTAHIGMIGSRDGIAREKREIFSAFRGGETAFIPANSDYADFLAEGVQGTVVRYGRQSAGVEAVSGRGVDGTILHCPEGDIHLRIPGRQMVENAIAALSVARKLEVPFPALKEGVQQVTPVFGRAEVLRGSVTVIQDCYNANPESMSAALELLADTPAEGRRIAVLGAMKELGEMESQAHRQLAEIATDLPIDEIVLVGDEFFTALGGDGVPRATLHRYDQWDQVVGRMKRVAAGDVVLLKGSRSVALERLTPLLMQPEAV